MEKTIDIDLGEHTSDLVKNLYNARKEERLCDVTIKVGSKNIPCHKIVLSEGCDYFRGMFAHPMKENESGVAEMECVDPECMMMCVQYIYTGKVSIPLQKAPELLQAAHMLQLTKLCDRIVFYLENGLDAESFFATRIIANTLSLKSLEATCNKFAMENFQYIAAMDEFKNLEKKYLTFLFRSKENKADESIKCKALLVWCYSDVENRTQTFEKNFLSLDFSKISKEYLSHLVENETLVFNSTSCLRRLIKTMSGASNVVSRDVSLKALDASSIHEGGTQDSSVNAIAVFDRTSKTLRTLNMEEKTWNVVKNLSNDFARKNFTAVVVENDIYVLVGDKSNYRLRYVDPNASWVRMPDRILTKEVAAVAFDGEIYAFDNRNENSRFIEKFNATLVSWTGVCDKPVRGRGSAVVAARGFIYCIGGSNGSYLNDVAQFEPSSETWTKMPPMHTRRCHATAVHLDKKIYVVGGSRDRGPLTTNERFDTMTRTWTSLTGLINPRSYFQACLIRGKIYAVGGFASENTIEEYDRAADEWKIIEAKIGEKVKRQASVALRL